MTAPRHEFGLCLFCRVGARVCAIPLQHVQETMRPLPVEPLSGAPSFVLGLSVIRGAGVPVVHASLLLDRSEAPPPMRFVMLAVGERRVALAVDSVIGIHPLGATGAEEPPPLLGEANLEVISAIGRLDRELLFVLNAARVVPEFMWRDLDAGGSQP
ncbi:MAG: chemotaxis protein CheW [Proteobacteria bacterium]|nr:chemotaxis protein CheW [Pseudomonadota bacterium]